MDGKMTRDEAEAVGKYHTQLYNERCLKSCMTIRNSAEFRLIFQRPYYLSLKPESVDNVITKCGLNFRQGKFCKFTDSDGRISGHSSRGPHHKLSDIQIKTLLTILKEKKSYHEQNNPGETFYIPFAKDMVTYFNEVAENGTLYQLKQTTKRSGAKLKTPRSTVTKCIGNSESSIIIIYVSNTYCNTKRTELLRILSEEKRTKSAGVRSVSLKTEDHCGSAYYNITPTPFFCFSDSSLSNNSSDDDNSIMSAYHSSVDSSSHNKIVSFIKRNESNVESAASVVTPIKMMAKTALVTEVPGAFTDRFEYPVSSGSIFLTDPAAAAQVQCMWPIPLRATVINIINLPTPHLTEDSQLTFDDNEETVTVDDIVVFQTPQQQQPLTIHTAAKKRHKKDHHNKLLTASVGVTSSFVGVSSGSALKNNSSSSPTESNSRSACHLSPDVMTGIDHMLMAAKYLLC